MPWPGTIKLRGKLVAVLSHVLILSRIRIPYIKLPTIIPTVVQTRHAFSTHARSRKGHDRVRVQSRIDDQRLAVPPVRNWAYRLVVAKPAVLRAHVGVYLRRVLVVHLPRGAQKSGFAHSASIACDATRAASANLCFLCFALVPSSSPKEEYQASDNGKKNGHSTNYSTCDRPDIRSIIVAIGPNG